MLPSDHGGLTAAALARTMPKGDVTSNSFLNSCLRVVLVNPDACAHGELPNLALIRSEYQAEVADDIKTKGQAKHLQEQAVSYLTLI